MFSVEELKQWPERLFSLHNAEFEALAINVFRHQATHNKVYKEYVQLRNVDIEKVERLHQIPFLPIELFKSHTIVTGNATPELIFESSRTTGQIPSRHFVLDAGLYHKLYVEGFKRAFGPINGHCILALLPSYLERGNSSLVYMAQGLMKESNHPDNGFYLNNLAELTTAIKRALQRNTPTLLLGVSFALLDMAEAFAIPLEHIKVMETGGMKGRRRELVREELHDVLKSAFKLPHIYSEYGMTELLSQAYTDGTDWFAPPTWMRVLARDAYDPLDTYATPASGGLNVIDLGNIHSCAFIATSDLTAIHADGYKFKVLGRMDISETRGCNLMVG